MRAREGNLWKGGPLAQFVYYRKIHRSKRKKRYTKPAPPPSYYVKTMGTSLAAESSDSLGRIEEAYRKEKPRFIARLRKTGRSLQEAEDILHDAYAELLENLPAVPDIRSLPAWINSLLGRRMIDSWRHERVRRAAGETSVAQETLEEIICGAGFDPHDEFVRESLMDALDDAIKALPAPQRKVIEAQVFGGQTFREIAERAGESIDTLTARKRYALANLAKALRRWIDD
jgi:RNA polymerase sigma factor (sigma-70 family)